MNRPARPSRVLLVVRPTGAPQTTGDAHVRRFGLARMPLGPTTRPKRLPDPAPAAEIP